MAPSRDRACTILVVLALALAAVGVRAQTGSAPVRLIVPTPPGVSADKVGAIVAVQLSSILGRAIVVENSHAGGMVAGHSAIAAAPADGDTIGLVVSTALIGGRLLSRSARYNPTEDFTWLAILGSYTNAMVIPARDPARTLAEWIDAKRRAGRTLVAAAYGPGSAGHLAASFLRVEQGVPLAMRFVDTQADGYALLTAGEVDVLFDGVPNATVELPRTGHRAIAVTSARPDPALPGVPAFGATWPGVAYDIWLGLVAPKGLPEFARTRLASAVGVLLLEPRHADALRAAGLRFLGIGGAAAVAFVDDEVLRTARQISRLGETSSRPPK